MTDTKKKRKNLTLRCNALNWCSYFQRLREHLDDSINTLLSHSFIGFSIIFSNQLIPIEINERNKWIYWTAHRLPDSSLEIGSILQKHSGYVMLMSHISLMYFISFSVSRNEWNIREKKKAFVFGWADKRSALFEIEIKNQTRRLENECEIGERNCSPCVMHGRRFNCFLMETDLKQIWLNSSINQERLKIPKKMKNDLVLYWYGLNHLRLKWFSFVLACQ